MQMTSMSSKQILSDDSGVHACSIRVADEIRDMVEAVHPGCVVEVQMAVSAGPKFTALAHGVFPGLTPIGAWSDESPTTPGFIEVRDGDSPMEAMLKLQARVLERVCPERTERKTMETVPTKLPRKTVRMGDV